MSTSRPSLLKQHFQGGASRGATVNLQVIEGGRKPAQRATESREIRDAIVAQLREHGHGIQAVSKRNGVSYRRAIDILIERYEIEKRTAYQQGFRQGRLTWLPLPPAPARRAA